MSDWTAADVVNLRAAVVSGVLSVRYDGPPGRTVVYQSLSEMRKLLAEMLISVGNTAGTHTSFRYAATSKGL